MSFSLSQATRVVYLAAGMQHSLSMSKVTNRKFNLLTEVAFTDSEENDEVKRLHVEGPDTTGN